MMRIKEQQHGQSAADSSDERPLVVIAGCGVSGAALALALQQRGMRVAVYEKDAGFDSRSQGYGLTMQQGMVALRQLAVDISADSISSSVHYSFLSCGKVIGCYGRAVDPASTETYSADVHASPGDATAHQHKPKRQHRIIGRQRLRQLILERLQPRTVKWGVSVCSYEELPQAVRVRLSDGSAISAACLVAADGIWSVVARQKLEHTGAMWSRPSASCSSGISIGQQQSSSSKSEAVDGIRYLGIMIVLGICRSSSLLDFPMTDGKTVFQTMDGSTRMYCMPFVDDTHPLFAWREGGSKSTSNCPRETAYMWQLSFPVPLDRSRELAGDKVRLKEMAIQLCGSWHDPVPLLIQITELDFITGYPAFDCAPLKPQTLRRTCDCEGGNEALCSSNCRLSRVTIIGDAAHPMSPFKGQGANQALIDSVALARALHQSSIGFETEAVGIRLGAAAPRYDVPGVMASDGRRSEDVCSNCLASSAVVSNDVSRSLSTEQHIVQALQVFEESMLARSTVKARGSNDAATILHSKEALQEVNGPRAPALGVFLRSNAVEMGSP